MRVFRIAAVVAFFCASGLFAQNTRSFVSAVSGSDTNNCTRPTPCRTFNVALSMTNAGGEVIVVVGIANRGSATAYRVVATTRRSTLMTGTGSQRRSVVMSRSRVRTP